MTFDLGINVKGLRPILQKKPEDSANQIIS